MAFYYPKSFFLLVVLITYLQAPITSSPTHDLTKVIEFNLHGIKQLENDPETYSNRNCVQVRSKDKNILNYNDYVDEEEPRKEVCEDVVLSPQEIQNARAYTQYLKGLNNHFWQRGLMNRATVISTSGFHEILAVLMRMAKADSPSKRELEQALGHPTLEAIKFLQIRNYLESLQVASSTVFYFPNTTIVSKNIQQDLRNMNVNITNSFEKLNEFVVTKSKGRANLENNDFKLRDPALINVISFQLKWQHRVTYDPERPIPFYLKDGTEVQVPMMIVYQNLESYVKDDHYFVVKIPFLKVVGHLGMKLNGLAAYVIAQCKDTPVPEISRELIDEVLEGMRNPDSYDITLKMPGIKLQAESKLTTNEFSKLLVSPNKDFLLNTDYLKFSIHQEAYLCMDDKGAVGGSTSASQLINLGLDSMDIFIVDHPYIILLALEETLEPIFVAKVDEVSTEMVACTRD